MHQTIAFQFLVHLFVYFWSHSYSFIPLQVDPDAKDLKYDWWSKYQASIPNEKHSQDYVEDGYDTLEVRIEHADSEYIKCSGAHLN